jgi:hypothetical protein
MQHIDPSGHILVDILKPGSRQCLNASLKTEKRPDIICSIVRDD